ncbi:uncharacterized protein LOC119375606 [Rhipicephalus sanguineus]|uniref:uncharacterized protein LOC119375606 n=1 Tax=Rhipicephalus sanguineus TaxID=34632 RepID=UPI0020C3F4F2|nr:uncharacterized protein LOC119375606 [Rhipicephalus sanguineus]
MGVVNRLSPIDNAPSSPTMFSVTDQEKPMPVVFHRLNIVPGGAKMTSSDPPGALTDASVNGTIKRLFSAALDSGHGGDAMMRSSNPIMFFVQVSKRYRKCYRSNNVCLFVLPCPWSMCEVLTNVTSSLRFLLLLSGDVESNPGPTDGDWSKQLKAIADDIKEIKKEKSVTNQKLTAIDKKLEKISGLEKQVSDCVKRIAELENNIKGMNRKIEELENRSRRSNLIVYGVEEQQNESFQKLHDFVSKEIFEDTLDIKTAGIERIHRLGRTREGEPKNRPIILKLLDYRDKVKILQSCSKLKGSGFSISEDYSFGVRETRRKLWNVTKENRDRGERVRLIFDKVQINGRLFTWDEGSKNIEVKKKRRATINGAVYSTTTPITLLNVNARSLANKVEQFEAVLLALKPDIVTVSETWLHSNICDHEIVPPS